MKPSELHREVIKLLIQVAWADQEITDQERGHLLATARASGMGETELEEIESALADPKSMTPPDYALLKREREDVQRAATDLVRVDGKVSPREVAILAGIHQLLGGDTPVDP